MSIDISSLEAVYLNNSLKDTAIHFNVSVPTILKRIKKVGIEMKGSGRPYSKGGPMYLSSNMFRSLNGIKTASTIGLFALLLLDKTFASNKWNGLSNISEFEFKSNQISNLEQLKNAGLIGEFEVVNGKILTEILDRRKFVLTENEYLKLEG